MLSDRIYRPGEDDIIYHYCSGQSLVSIIESARFRFSDVNMMNDAEEGRWGYDKFIETANRILNRDVPEVIPQVPTEFIDRIDALWALSPLKLSSMVACLSTDGDSLGQWRAYADDGRGFAVGFKAKQLFEQMPIQMLKVLYDGEAQVREFVVAIGAAYLEFLDKNSDLEAPWLFERTLGIIASSLAFKNPAWREENEIRCQHVVTVNSDDSKWTLSDPGGTAGTEIANCEPIGFQVRSAAIVPYVDLPFRRGTDCPIKEIVFGPKCPNLSGNVLFLFGNNDCGRPDIKRAGSAYR